MGHVMLPTDPTPPARPWETAGPSLVRADGSPLQVLIVEDEQLVALDLAAIVEQHGGVALDVAATAEAAIRLAIIHQPDIVLMDVRLAPGDGVATAKAIRADVAAAIVFVTGNTDPTTLQRIAEVGSWPVLTKPVAIHELCDAILRAYGQEQSRR